jgi:hypothetical protein
MSAVQCPKCKVDLEGDKCVKCGWKFAETAVEQMQAAEGQAVKVSITQSSGSEKAAATDRDEQKQGPKAEPQADGDKQAEGNKLPPEPRRNLTPASPQQAKGQASDESSKEKTPVLTPEKKDTPAVDSDSPVPLHPTPPHEAGVPSSRPRNLRAAQAFALKGNKKAKAQSLGQLMQDHFSQLLRSAASQAIVGDHNAMAEFLDQSTHIHMARDIELGIGTPKSLWEITTNLHPRPAQVPGSQSYSPGKFAQQLREASLIFISSAADRVALGAAYCLIDELGIEPEQRLLVDFESTPVKFNFSTNFFTQEIIDEERKPTAVVVEGFSKQASDFLDWLMTIKEFSEDRIRQQLRDNRLNVLCLVDESYFQSRGSKGSGTQRFATWPVPFLEPLLSHYFPDQSAELEQQIRKQQREGKWKKADSELYEQIRPYLDNEELPRELASRASADFATEDIDLPQFRGGQSIEDTLLYVATYFPNLAPHEFDRVVSTLLRGKTMTVTVKSSRQNKDGETETIETEVEKPLLDFWDAEPDKYLTACQLEAAPGKDSRTTIDFADSEWRQELRTRLEKRHSLYLMRQFQAVQKAKFLFNSTPRIIANVMRLSVDLAVAHPDSFGKEWLFQMTRQGATNTTSTEAEASSETVHQRIPQLLRQMLGKAQLKETVEGLLKELMTAGAHDSVLYIIRGLQFAPRFDEFIWMRRLLNEADEQVRNKTYYHLYGYIKKIGIYPLISKLDAWLPTDERTSESYSISTMYALRLLVEYCSETTESFDPRYYGLTQPLHPLLSFIDEASVRESINRLLKWLFHPGMEIVFDDLESVFAETDFENYLTPFVCELVVEWMFVLHGCSATGGTQRSADSPQPNDEVPSETDSGIDAVTVRDILIEEIARATNPVQRNEMLFYWERLRDFMAIILSLRRDSVDWIEPPDFHERAGIRWRRELVRELIKRFRGAIRELQVAAKGSAVVSVERQVG